MEITIKSLNVGTFDYISEALGTKLWYNSSQYFYEDGVEVCDVSVNIERVKVEVLHGGEVWFSIGDCLCMLEHEDFLEIIIY